MNYLLKDLCVPLDKTGKCCLPDWAMSSVTSQRMKEDMDLGLLESKFVVALLDNIRGYVTWVK